MSKDNIKRRHSKTLNLSPLKRNRPLTGKSFDRGGLFGDYNGEAKGLGWGKASKEALDEAFSLENIPSSLGAVTGAISTMADTFTGNSQIADTSAIENNISETKNTNFTGATDTDSLLDSWNSINWQDADYTAEDIRGVSTGEMIGNTIGAVGSGLAAGAKLGGPWGAVAGGIAGLGSSLAGIFTGDSKAEQKASELNQAAEKANIAAQNRFAYQADKVHDNMYSDLARNISAYGGTLMKDGGKIYIKPSKRGTFTAAAKKRGKGVQEFARQVLANKENYSPAMVKKANFARNFGGRKKANGGYLEGEDLNLGENHYDTNSLFTGINTGYNIYATGGGTLETGPSEELEKEKGGGSTPISGGGNAAVEFIKDAAWTGAEAIPFAGTALSAVDVWNDVRNLTDSNPNTSGDWGTLLLDVAGLIPGVGTLAKGAKLLKLAKAAQKLSKFASDVEYTNPKKIREIKGAIHNIQDYNNKVIRETTNAALSRNKEDMYKAAMKGREAAKMNEGMLNAVDNVLNPSATGYKYITNGLKWSGRVNDVVDITGTENEKAMGGKLNTHGTEWSNGLTYINTGGTHEQNPFDGVQMGMDAQNIPNLVEEGEVIFNDYVFSNRLHPTEDELESVNLPNKYKNSSFAYIAEDLGKESSERPNDPISRRGLEDMMSRLATAQEMQRKRKGKKGTQQLMAYGGRKYAGPWDTEEPDIYSNYKGWNPAVVEEMLHEQQLIDDAKTGINPDIIEAERAGTLQVPTSYKSTKSSTDKSSTNKSSTDSKQKSLPTFTRYAPAVGSAIGALQSAFATPDYENADILMTEANSLPNSRVSFRPIGDYLTYRPLDRNYYLNQLRGQAGATRRAIMNSGANAASAMTGLLAADYNAQNAIGNTLMQIQQYNDAQRQKTAEFNRGTNQFNSQGLYTADAANAQLAADRSRLRASLLSNAAQMRENADAQLEASRSANMTNFFDNLGGIGTENFIMNQIASNPSLYYQYTAPGKGTVGFKGKNGGMLTKKDRRRK